MKALRDDNILKSIRGNRNSRERMLELLYRDKPLKGAIMRMLLRNKGSENDYDRIINETLVRFYKICITKKDFCFTTNYINYLLGIAHFIWLKDLKDEEKHTSEILNEEIELEYEDIEVNFLEKERRKILRDLLSFLGQNCKEVLMFWSSGYSMIEIAEKMGYKSSGMAKKKKHNCMKELYSYLDENPDVKEELM